MLQWTLSSLQEVIHNKHAQQRADISKFRDFFVVVTHVFIVTENNLFLGQSINSLLLYKAMHASHTHTIMVEIKLSKVKKNI